MSESYEISFVTWPNGKVDENSLTVGGERIAKARIVQSWLPTQWFGSIDDYKLSQLFLGMENKGFKVHTIVIGKDDEPKIKE